MTIEFKAGATGIDPVYICHGADHDFKIAAGADSPWVNHGVSFNQVPGESSPITTEPELGTYQTLLAAGTEWTLTCPANGTDIDFDLQLQSEFTAAPCKVALKLGDYRRAILSKRNPISAPVVGDKVAAEVQIGSFYTGKELEGVEVEWYYYDDEEIVQKVPTTGLGWSKFEHAFTTAGEHTITAKVHSLYDDTTAEEKFTINVYAESPWEQATLLINGNKVEWGAELVLLRGQTNEVTVEAPPAIARELNLGLVEDGGLNIVASPSFGERVEPVDGQFHWAITPDAGKSGRITLSFHSQEVQVLWEHRSLVISSNLADEAQALIGGEVVPPEGVIFTLEAPQVVTLGLKANSPLAGHPVKLTYTIIDGDLSLNSEPPFDGFQTDHRWAVTGVSGAGTFRLSLAGEGMSQELDAPNCRVRSGQPSLRFYYKSVNKYAPLPPEVINHRVNQWRSVDLKLIHADGSPIAGVIATMYRPEHKPLYGKTNSQGELIDFSAYQYTTTGPRTFEAVVTLPSGEVRATYLIDVQP
ncbi:hypothetical protein EMIT0196MI5_100135 [Pseudomonas sp. IT-196MI5]|uniref:hypothetical protein n=1 Tax=unclassified Pseudomonas TaxID=196821 RepID=UPI0039DF5586